MSPLASALAKRVKAVELFAAGCSYAEVAREVGFTNRGSAHRAVTLALSTYGNRAVDHVRMRELERLDALHAGHWANAMTGDLSAAKIILEVTRQRRRWLGQPR